MRPLLILNPLDYPPARTVKETFMGKYITLNIFRYLFMYLFLAITIKSRN
jgi:hypothetical protein